MKAFATKREAVRHLESRNRVNSWVDSTIRIFHKHGDKRKKSWFVGTQLEWLNK